MTRRSPAILMLCAFHPAASWAINPPAPCSKAQYNVEQPQGKDALALMHPVLSRHRYVALVDSGRWADAIGAVRADAADAFAEAKVGQAEQTKFFAEADEVISKLQQMPNDNSRALYIATFVRPERFNPDFNASSEYVLFPGTADRILIDTPLDERQQEALCWAAMSADVILFRLNLPLEGPSIARLSKLTKSWDNYRTYGYSVQPFELLFQRGNIRDSLPHKAQWMIGHLSAGGELRGWSAPFDSLKGDQSVVVEVLGALGYWNNFTQYAGASAIITIASSRPVGAGVLIHLGRGLRGGAVFRKENGGTTTSALMSSDLYGLFDRSKKPIEDAYHVARSLVILPGRP
jgi:hypothetical protein